MVSFFDKVKIFRFWPKTMDYSPWFDFWESEKVLRKIRHMKEHLKSFSMNFVWVKLHVQ